MKLTKEDLLMENGTALAKLDSALARDKEIRQEFAYAFSWFKQKGPYDNGRELLNPSWNQIFVEIGKLQATQSFYDLQDSVTELHRQITNLNEKFINEEDCD